MLTNPNHGMRLFTIATALLAPAALVAQGDTILRKDNKHITKCTILKLEIDKITYKKGSKEANILTSRISGFTFGNPPEQYSRAESSASRNNFKGAATLYGEAADAAKSDALKNTATFFSGRSFAIAAETDGTLANSAVGKLEAYIAAAPTGYYLPEAKVRLAQARMSGGDAAAAETMLTAMSSEASSGGWPMRWQAHIQYSLAKAQFSLGKFPQARANYSAVGTAADGAMGQDNSHNAELTAIKTDALVMQGETYIGEKLLDDALRYFQTLATSTAKGVKAAAHAGQGQILFLQGSSDTTKLRQAQLALARASIEPDTSDATSAKALYYMGKVLMALGDKEKGSQGRAKTYFQSVKNNYGTTTWAQKARQELDG